MVVRSASENSGQDRGGREGPVVSRATRKGRDADAALANYNRWGWNETLKVPLLDDLMSSGTAQGQGVPFAERVVRSFHWLRVAVSANRKLAS